MKDLYNYDPGNRVWKKAGHIQLPYSDGDDVENYLLSIVINAKDVSTKSLELREAIRDWPSEYHLSMQRHNLLRPFKLNHSAQILELGCGCGAITRYLGEIGASVTAVEGSMRRAQIAAERCRDLPNVKIVCDNINEFISDQKYDYIMLIGVLEYSPIFINSKDPVRSILDHVKYLLNDNGILIIAIENALGLKYFNGCSEDHTSTPYLGIQDLYDQNGPITYGKKELKENITTTGFKNINFYYPFPDYKLPKLILAPEAIENKDLNIGDLLCTIESRDYSGNPYRAFNENFVWPLIARNGLVSDLSNSFLIIASKSETVQTQIKKKPWIAIFYSTERKPQYAVETSIVQLPNNNLEVEKDLVFPDNLGSQILYSNFSHQPISKSSFIPGKLLITRIKQQVAKRDNIYCIIKPWINLLQSKSSEPENALACIPGKYLDCIPRNIICDSYDNLSYFDAEWVAEYPVPLGWVLIRGLLDSLLLTRYSEQNKSLKFIDIIIQILNSCNLNIMDKDLDYFSQLENELQNEVFGYTIRMTYKDIFNITIYNNLTFYDRIQSLEKEIIRLKSTYSWKYTKPFRFLRYLIRSTLMNI